VLTKTSVSAIRLLVHLASEASDRPIPPRRMASELSESPSYLAKSQIAKAGILRMLPRPSHR